MNLNIYMYITTRKGPPSKDVDNSRLQNNIKNLGQTTCSIINELVTSIFIKLQTTKHTDSIWIPKMILNIPTTPCVSSLLPPSTTPINNASLFHFFKFHQLILELSLNMNSIILRIVISVLRDTKVRQMVKDWLVTSLL